jgi:hypothetical protein
VRDLPNKGIWQWCIIDNMRKVKRIPETPNARTRALLQQAEKGLKEGKTSLKFKKVDELINYLRTQDE